MTGVLSWPCKTLVAVVRGMRPYGIGLASVVLFVGCEAQQTHIVKTTRYPDGTEVRYSNMSSGYGYNPNIAFDMSVQADPRAPSPDAAARVPARAVEAMGHGTAPVVYPSQVVIPVPVIAPAATGGYWGPSPWATGMPVMPGAFGAGVFGPPIPNFGFGCR
jgi:hypothetical protein